MSRIAIVSGSARKDGESGVLINDILQMVNADVIHLVDHEIEHFNYEQKYKSNDFTELMKKLISNYDTYIFITPVYWYSMSGILKVFFDRLTDLLHSEKEWGRKLRTKSMAVLTTSNGGNLGEKFWFPFVESAGYLGIRYLGNVHSIKGKAEHIELAELADKINS